MNYDIEEIRSIYKDLFEYSLDLIFVNKLNGDFLDANNNLLNTFGLKREDIPQYSLSDIMDKDQLTKAYKAIKEKKKTGRQSDMMELRINGKDGIKKVIGEAYEANIRYNLNYLYDNKLVVGMV